MLAERSPSAPGLRPHRHLLASAALGRPVELSVLLPPDGLAGPGPLPVLYLNDGQDLARLHLPATLAALYAQAALRPFVLVAPHAGEQRVQEYGTAGHPDFNGRGSRAAAYTEFVLNELRPFAARHYPVSLAPADAVVAGFSLGGLTAFDLAWHHPEAFARAGAFSGSFWWRQKAVGAGYTPADRIMHQLVRARAAHPAHRFWLQTGTLDEKGTATKTASSIPSKTASTSSTTSSPAASTRSAPCATCRWRAATTTPTPGAACCPTFCAGPSAPPGRWLGCPPRAPSCACAWTRSWPRQLSPPQPRLRPGKWLRWRCRPQKFPLLRRPYRLRRLPPPQAPTL